MLKLQYPHQEAVGEGDALRLWNGGGAVLLIDRDETNHALLLERCDSGTHLSVANLSDALDVLIALLPRLWVPTDDSFISLADEAVRWSEQLPDRYTSAGEPCELGHSREAVLYRFDRLTAELDLDRDRARGWTIGQTLAWAMCDGQVHERHIATARWLLDAS